MKLLRWAVAGASVYAVYKYSIGRKARGEDVFVSQDKEVAKLEAVDQDAAPPASRPKPARKSRTRSKATSS